MRRASLKVLQMLAVTAFPQERVTLLCRVQGQGSPASRQRSERLGLEKKEVQLQGAAVWLALARSTRVCMCVCCVGTKVAMG